MQRKIPRVSVLMPVYNSSRYLLEAMKSILRQTFSDFEFIIVNDGSTDGSESIVRSVQDPRIQVFNQTNIGCTASLNRGIGYARGEYIARMDADDIAFPDRLEKQVAFLDKNLDHVAVGSRILAIDPEGCPISFFSEQTTHAEIDSAYLAGKAGIICHPAVTIRRSALHQVGGYREELKSGQDRDLFLRLAEIGKLANLPEVLLKYRLHPKSVGHTRRSEQRSYTNWATLEAYKRRGLQPPDNLLNSGSEPEYSLSEIHCRWAWWALKAGYIRTARKHALQALAKNPLALTSWKVLACTIRGY